MRALTRPGGFPLETVEIAFMKGRKHTILSVIAGFAALVVIGASPCLRVESVSQANPLPYAAMQPMAGSPSAPIEPTLPRDVGVAPDLNARMRIVAHSSDLADGANGYPGTWLTDHLLLVPANLGLLPPASGRGTLVPPSSTGRLIVDVDSGKRSEAPAFERLRGASTISASPDGRWILWFRPTDNSLCGSNVTRSDGSKTIAWTQEFNGLGSAWMPDSRHWLQATYVIGSISPSTHKAYGAPGVLGNEQIVRVDKSGG